MEPQKIRRGEKEPEKDEPARKLPEFRKRTFEYVDTIDVLIDLVLLVVNDNERKAVLQFLEPLEETQKLLKYYSGDATPCIIGKYGAFVVAVVRCMMGSGTYGAHNVVAAALRTLQPRGIINVGGAFGRNSNKQHLGDVLVSHKIISYESSRVGTDKDGKEKIEFLVIYL